jgi:hypothetical protein
MGSGAKKGAVKTPENLAKKPVDDWPDGLNISIKSLSAKSVKRAGQASGVVAVCARHNLRQNNANHRHRKPIDPARKHLNSVIVGDACPEAVAATAADSMAAFGLTYPGRFDAVAAFELVIQPPAGCDTVDWWCAAMRWVHEKYEHVVSAVVHRDQKRPHCHVLALAIQGGALAGRSLQRGGWAFRTLHASFGQHMLGAMGAASAPVVDELTRLALKPGRGPKTHEAAKRRDAMLMRAPWVRQKREDIACGHCPNVLTLEGSMSIVAQSPGRAVSFEKEAANNGFGVPGWSGWQSREWVMSAAAMLA